MSNRKVLSECSNGQYNLYRDHNDESSSTEKVISSDALKTSMDTDNFIFPVSVNTEGNPLMEGHAPALGNVNYVTPNKNKFEAEGSYENSPNQAVPAIDFASLQAADFGITPDSFTKLCKGDSKSLLKKFRRRSTIGVRGSPENNSLIRYIAFLRGRKKRESLSQVSPSKCCSTLLKNKIAAFQASFQPFEETEERINQISGVRNSVTPNTYTADRTGEQSKLGVKLPSACRSVAAEENQTHNPMNEESCAAPTQVVPGLQENIVESHYRALETTLYTLVSNTTSGSTPQLLNEELGDAAPQQSCKKVRFAEKLELKIFDTEPPFTPVQKGDTHANPHRSVLKNTPRRQLTESAKEHLDDKRMKAGSTLNPTLKTCGPLQIERSAGSRDEIPVDIPVCKQAAVLSPSDSGEKSSCRFQVEQPLSRLNFDHDDVPPQQPLEVEPVTGSAINSDMEAAQSVSSALQPASVRITRSSVKRKCVSKAEEKDLNPAGKIQTKNVAVVKIPKLHSTPKSSRNTTAASHKYSGKRRKRRRKKKGTCGQRETVSRKPLLSPILETAEDLSWVPSFPATLELETSVSDNCQSNTPPAALVNENENGELHSSGENCLDFKLVLGKEVASSEIPSSLCPGLQESAANIMKTGLPWKPPGEEALERLNSQCPSMSNELQDKLHKAGRYNESKGDSIPVTSSAAEVTESDANVNFKISSRRSKRLTSHHPSADSFDSESTVGGDLPSPASTGNDLENLNDLACWIEESFRNGEKSYQKRVRRSMRGRKDSETEGLAWIFLPASNGIQPVLHSPCKGQRCTSTPTHKEPEPFHQEQVRSKSTLLPRKRGPMAGVHVARRSSVSKTRRNSICLPNLEENKVISAAWKNRRASLGYKSDHSYFP